MNNNKPRQRRRETSSLLPLLLLFTPATTTNAFLRRREEPSAQQSRHLRSPIYWWYTSNPSLPGGGECVENSSYPENYPIDFPKLLYKTKEECCDNHQDISCLMIVPQTTVVATLPPIPPLTNEPTHSPVPKVARWYPIDGECKFDKDYPDWMGAGVNTWSYLFDMQSDCCTVHGCGAEDRPEKWWPKKTEDGDGGYGCVLNNDYPAEFLDHDGLLFESEEACCAVFCGLSPTTTTSTTEEPIVVKEPSTTKAAATEATQAVTTSKAAATTTESKEQNSSSTGKTPGSNCPESKWHISTVKGGANTCTNDNKYPPFWEGTEYLMDSASACCDLYYAEEECYIQDVCEHLYTGLDCPEMKWHISILAGSEGTCTNDSLYPSEWESGSTQHLFDSAMECCDRFFPIGCKVVDHCGCSTNWHMSTMPGAKNTCTNDENYPESWLDMAHKYFYRTPEECCQAYFDDEDCSVKDVCLDCIETWHVNPEKPGSSW